MKIVVVDNPKEDATKEEQITYNFLQYQKELKQKSKNQPSSSTNKEKDSATTLQNMFRLYKAKKFARNKLFIKNVLQKNILRPKNISIML